MKYIGRMNFRSFIFLLGTFFISQLSYAQLPSAIIDVNGSVYGEVNGNKIGAARVLLIFSPDDTVRTDASGDTKSGSRILANRLR